MVRRNAKGVSGVLAQPSDAFPVKQVNGRGIRKISMHHWHQKWRDVKKLDSVEFSNFCKTFDKIQQDGVQLGGKNARPIDPKRLKKKKVGYPLSGPLYEIRLGGAARLFIGMEEDEPSCGYLMYVDPSHDMTDFKGKHF